MTAAWDIAAKIVRALPVWLWALLLALGWGAWQRHNAKAVAAEFQQAQQQAAAERERKLAAELAETARRLAANKKVIEDAEQNAARLRADADAAAAGERRLRARLAALQANPRAADPAAAGGSAPAGEAIGVLTDVLGRCITRVRELGRFADEAHAAGLACEQSYTSLIPPSP